MHLMYSEIVIIYIGFIVVLFSEILFKEKIDLVPMFRKTLLTFVVLGIMPKTRGGHSSTAFGSQYPKENKVGALLAIQGRAIMMLDFPPERTKSGMKQGVIIRL